MTEPNDQMGSVDSPPWAGVWMYDQPGRHGTAYIVASVVVIQEDGTVEMFHYDSDESLAEAWLNFQDTVDFPEPEQDDFIIGVDEWGFRLWVGDGTLLGRFSTPMQALKWLENETGVNCEDRNAWLREEGKYKLLEWPGSEPEN